MASYSYLIELTKSGFPFAGVVNFHKSKNPNEQLNEWSHDISTLMSLVQKTTHLINKEEMVHKHMRVGGPDNDK